MDGFFRDSLQKIATIHKENSIWIDLLFIAM